MQDRGGQFEQDNPAQVSVVERILEQGQVLVRAIEAMQTIEPTGPIERVQVWFLL